MIKCKLSGLGKKIDYTIYLLHNSDKFYKDIKIFLKSLQKIRVFFWHNKDQEAGLNPTYTVHCGGTRPRPSQQTTFETLFKRRTATSVIKTSWIEHDWDLIDITPLLDSFDLTTCSFSWYFRGPECLLAIGKGTWGGEVHILHLTTKFAGVCWVDLGAM